jgi:hypothetical protein
MRTQGKIGSKSFFFYFLRTHFYCIFDDIVACIRTTAPPTVFLLISLGINQSINQSSESIGSPKDRHVRKDSSGCQSVRLEPSGDFKVRGMWFVVRDIWYVC